MKVASFTEVPSQDMRMEGAAGVQMRVLIGEPDGAPNFVMRQFEVQPGGHTPRHHHPYEHQVYILAGAGVVYEGDRQRPIHAGDCVFVPSDEVHQFENTGPEPLRFLCMIPRLDKCGM